MHKKTVIASVKNQIAGLYALESFPVYGQQISRPQCGQHACAHNFQAHLSKRTQHFSREITLVAFTLTSNLIHGGIERSVHHIAADY